MHLLLVLAWSIGMRGARPAEPPQRVSSLVFVQALCRPQPAPKRLPAPPRTRQRVAAAMPATTLAPQAAPVDPEPEPGTAPQADPAPGPALPGDIVACARAMAGGVDRELR